MACQPCEKGKIKVNEGDQPAGCDSCSENTTTLNLASEMDSHCGGIHVLISQSENYCCKELVCACVCVTTEDANRNFSVPEISSILFGTLSFHPNPSENQVISKTGTWIGKHLKYFQFGN